MANKFYNTDFQEFLTANKITSKEMAEYFGVSMAYISLLVQGKSRLSLEKLKRLQAESKWDSSMLHSLSEQTTIGNNNIIANATAPNATATNNIDFQEKYLDLLSKKDEQMDRLIAIIEQLSK